MSCFASNNGSTYYPNFEALQTTFYCQRYDSLYIAQIGILTNVHFALYCKVLYLSGFLYYYKCLDLLPTMVLLIFQTLKHFKQPFIDRDMTICIFHRLVLQTMFSLHYIVKYCTCEVFCTTISVLLCFQQWFYILSKL